MDGPAKSMSTALGELKYEPEGPWWFLQDSTDGLEVVIGGGAEGPATPDIQFAREVRPLVDRLVATAGKYLDAFASKTIFSETGAWSLASLYVKVPPVTSPDTFGLCFTHPGDLYGWWIVGFRRFGEEDRKLLKVVAAPISFHREQY
jgi:hypothetical protein